MAIARVQMPDGRIGRFEVPEGTTPEQAEQLASQSMPKPQKMGTLASAASRAKEYGYGTAQALGAELSPETLAGLKDERSRQSFGGQAATDFALGIPMQLAASAIPVTGGPVGSGAVSGGLQAGMLPVQPDESRAGNVALGAGEGAVGGKVGQLVTKAVAPVVRPATSALGRLASRATGAVESHLSPDTTRIINAATERFGFRLLPGQTTGVSHLRGRESGYHHNASQRMTELQNHNQQTFNRNLATEMGVPEARQITSQVEATARQRVQALELRALQGKIITLNPNPQNPTFTTAIGNAIQNSTTPATILFGNRAQQILTRAAQLNQIDGMDYKWLRSDLQTRAASFFNSNLPGSNDAGRALRSVVTALDDAFDQNARLPMSRISQQDLADVRQARTRWKAILTVRDSRRGNFDIDPNKWATKAQEWYRPGEPLHELIEVVDNVPDFRKSVGLPDNVNPRGGQPMASATVGPSGANVRVGEGLGGMTAGALEGPYMGAARLNYYTPAEINRRALAQALGLTTSVGGREVNDYVTRR